jgi:hypothetical protein
VVAAGRARAQSIEMVSKALGEVNGSNAAALAVAEKYVTAFQSLARTNNTLILPANTGDVSSMVAQVRIWPNKTEKSFSNLAASQFCFSRSNKSIHYNSYFCKVA